MKNITQAVTAITQQDSLPAEAPEKLPQGNLEGRVGITSLSKRFSEMLFHIS